MCILQMSAKSTTANASIDIRLKDAECMQLKNIAAAGGCAASSFTAAAATAASKPQLVDFQLLAAVCYCAFFILAPSSIDAQHMV